jgi:hypothetical protein
MPPNCWKPSQDNVRNALIGLQEMVKGELTGDDVTVVLLLPTDDAPLADRAAALGQWCQGFLTGFGLNAGGKDLSTEAKEVLQDLAAISQVQDALEESEDGEATTWKSWSTCASRRCCCSPKPRSRGRRRQAVAALIEGKPSAHDPYPKAEYSRRRKALMAQMVPNSIAILPAAAVAIRNRDVEHVYRQDSDFQYLSGFPEPEAVIVLMPGREHGEYVLFCRERNAERELWDGLRAGQEGAMRDFRRRRCLSHHRHRRHPAGPDRRPRPGVFGHGQQPRVRPAPDGLDQRDPLQGAPGRPAAERIRCPGSSAARHAPV